ncbi:hypothetical protein P0082_05190 [Candidatus Haliotispira prima]|uniref:Uncharacterized protein n=1 Tax=Candidatus Haliotispira prima TaxID=3034016 RepID=A0ABY8MKX3_9SPIO|nr:hypothetical protein P0082_05190 [Candidatus Haliotispira prima]
MSIRLMDIQSTYLRMGEVSREQDKKIKKEDREQSFRKQMQKSREENSDHTVGQAKETHADQTVKEHEDRGLPVRKKPHEEKSEDLGDPFPRKQQRSAQDLALPMITLAESTPTISDHPLNYTQDPYDPDLGHHINIES